MQLYTNGWTSSPDRSLCCLIYSGSFRKPIGVSLFLAVLQFLSRMKVLAYFRPISRPAGREESLLKSLSKNCCEPRTRRPRRFGQSRSFRTGLKSGGVPSELTAIRTLLIYFLTTCNTSPSCFPFSSKMPNDGVPSFARESSARALSSLSLKCRKGFSP